MTDSRRNAPLCLLTFHSPDGSSQECMAELTALARPLALAKRRVLIHFAGVSSIDAARPQRLPANVELLEASAMTADGLNYRGRKMSSACEFGKPAACGKTELSPTEATVIRILNFVRSNEDVGLISQAVKQDPGLLHNLLRYLNSARMFFNTVNGGFRNIEQAIMFMGYRQFSRWLSLYLLHAAVEASMPALYLASIVRARQMEILAKPAGFTSKHHDRIFITGVFSLLHEITGLPMAAILESLELDAPVRDALLEGSGDYAPLLALAAAGQGGAPAELSRRIAAVGVSAREVNLALLKAIQFASDFD
ncbi:MAG TPA: HDOD domain-containing protein [Azonexus sp.]